MDREAAASNLWVSLPFSPSLFFLTQLFQPLIRVASVFQDFDDRSQAFPGRWCDLEILPSGSILAIQIVGQSSRMRRSVGVSACN